MSSLGFSEQAEAFVEVEPNAVTLVGDSVLKFVVLEEFHLNFFSLGVVKIQRERALGLFFLLRNARKYVIIVVT